jgi:uncharacterized membrane protein
VIPAIVMIVAGGLVVAVGVLGRLGRLPRNRLAGVRTSATLRSDRAFEVGNRAAGPATMLGGGAAMVSGLIGLFLPGRDAAGCVLVGAVVMVALAVAGAVRGNRAAARADR